jgi:hypothetical protein
MYKVGCPLNGFLSATLGTQGTKRATAKVIEKLVEDTFFLAGGFVNFFLADYLNRTVRTIHRADTASRTFMPVLFAVRHDEQTPEPLKQNFLSPIFGILFGYFGAAHIEHRYIHPLHQAIYTQKNIFYVFNH